MSLLRGDLTYAGNTNFLVAGYDLINNDSSRYGENNICSACPGVGVSQVDYNAHVTRHHIHRDKVVFNPNNEFWNVLLSSVNLPTDLNNPAKGEQKNFFT